MTHTFGLVGNPVGHSLSPRMHAAWIAAAGLDAVYLPFEVAPETTGPAILDAIRTLGLGGVNLTVPFKERVVPHLDAIDPLAARVGAVNTVVARPDGLWGTNTDVAGFVTAVNEAGADLHGTTALVLGAGGAARAVALGVADAGAAAVHVLNRTPSRAEAVAEAVRAACPDVAVHSGPLDAFDQIAPRAGLVAMTVSKPGRDAIAALDPSAVAPDAWWVDLNYWDPSPPLVAPLTRRGVRTLDGLGMLVHQGSLAFTAFTGAPADPAVGRAALGGGFGP